VYIVLMGFAPLIAAGLVLLIFPLERVEDESEGYDK
jgi:hypothetical protein